MAFLIKNHCSKPSSITPKHLLKFPKTYFFYSKFVKTWMATLAKKVDLYVHFWFWSLNIACLVGEKTKCHSGGWIIIWLGKLEQSKPVLPTSKKVCREIHSTKGELGFLPALNKYSMNSQLWCENSELWIKMVESLRKSNQ